MLFRSQEVLSRSSSICSLRFAEQLSMELRKTKGSLGISVAVSVEFAHDTFPMLTLLLHSSGRVCDAVVCLRGE